MKNPYSQVGTKTKMVLVEEPGQKPRFKPVLDSQPKTLTIEQKVPETIEETVRKHALRRQYMENLSAIAERTKNLGDIDDEFESDEEAFTAAEQEYLKSQEESRRKKEEYFKKAAELEASKIAKAKEERRKKLIEEAEKLGLNVEDIKPKASAASGNEDE